MRYFLAIIIMAIGFWFWMQPRDKSVFTGTHGNTMAEAEKAYYIQMFNHAMSHVLDGNSYPWESYNSKGEFTPTETYASKSKSLCRHFTEHYTIGQYSGEQNGIACKRKGKAGWCRLKPGNAETCALEVSNPSLTFGQLNVGRVDLGSIKLGDMELSIPTTEFDTGGIGHVETPDVDGPDVEFPMRERKDGETSAEWLIQ